MTLHLPQLIYLGLTILGLGVAIAKHGERREPHNAAISLLSSGICIGLLYWGGFFG